MTTDIKASDFSDFFNLVSQVVGIAARNGKCYVCASPYPEAVAAARAAKTRLVEAPYSLTTNPFSFIGAASEAADIIIRVAGDRSILASFDYDKALQFDSDDCKRLVGLTGSWIALFSRERQQASPSPVKALEEAVSALTSRVEAIAPPKLPFIDQFHNVRSAIRSAYVAEPSGTPEETILQALLSLLGCDEAREKITAAGKAR